MMEEARDGDTPDRRYDTDKKFCSILFDVMAEKGVKDVVCSPGSRNAPLLIAAASRDELKKHVVIDERSAAFMALGMAVVSRRPVALVCTSGTALLNYGPAIAEAFYQSVPLVVISADRPEQWIDQDDSQTLRQFEAFSNYVKRSYQLPAFGNDDKELQWYANRIVNDAMIEATSRRRGPVHINIQLGEPLSRKVNRGSDQPRVIDFIGGDSIGNKEIVRELATKIAASKVLLVAGFLPPDSRLHKSVGEICALPNVVAMTETLSNLHLGNDATSIDSVLTAYSADRLDSEVPDLVISLGGSLVSRKLKEYLRRNANQCEHWALGWNHTTSDCFMSLTKRIEVDPARLLHQLAAALRRQPILTTVCDFASIWRRLRAEAVRAKSAFVEAAPWSDLKAFDIIFRKLPQDVNLFLSNGTAVRYAQILGERMPHASYCNRGVSGIDGSVSTAIGGAKAYKGRTVVITGDMSMAYDLNALALPDMPGGLVIIVVDNGGGGIFRFIPTTSSLEERERYFCAPPKLPLGQLAPAYGFDYAEASDEEHLSGLLHEIFTMP
ncbi:MAG: 2-succinyl-5-enolpyruvyl-6-hydroxy-3-cyclohexene-1-carboxylic-acid synthase, partial [Muribaculaceae bacterium]|nr:2-succinyl-5-enolpyruvyl-6-hydroxy-3-cyclohexene-1-carboxylic-acid synthase [Muribaculaceae bacterium]